VVVVVGRLMGLITGVMRFLVGNNSLISPPTSFPFKWDAGKSKEEGNLPTRPTLPGNRTV